MTDTRARALEALAAQTIELPSWAFGNSGTRFKVFGQPGVARDPYEKLEDAAQVHKYTGVAPRVSLHVPWDLVDDFGKLASHAADLAVTTDEGLLALNAAIERLNSEMPRLADVVECRFFGGMTEEETATALGIGLRTAKRDWAKAKIWLHREITS